MKHFVAAILAVALTASAPILVRAGEISGTDHTGYVMGRLTQRLGLTPQQQQQIQPILRQSFASLRQLHEQAQTQAYNTLTPEHRAQVEQIVQQVHQQIAALHASMLRSPTTSTAAGAPTGAHPFAQLHAQIRPIVEQAARSIDSFLTPQEGQAVLAVRAGAFQQGHAIITSTAAQIDRFLNPNQQQRVAEFLQKMEAHKAGLARTADPGLFLIRISATGVHQPLR